MAGYVDLEALKSSLQLTGETFADADLQLAIDAATSAVNAECGRRFTEDTVDQERSYPVVRRGRLELDDLISVTEIRSATDGQDPVIWASNDYVLMPYNAPADGRPWTELRLTTNGSVVFRPDEEVGTVTVTGKFGWPEVPASIKEATSILATRLMKRAREAPFGIAGMGIDGMAVRVMSYDPDVRMLLGPYIKPVRLS